MIALSTLLEMAPSVLDHLWTQDSPISPLTCVDKLGPYIGQGRSQIQVFTFEEQKRLLQFECIVPLRALKGSTWPNPKTSPRPRALPNLRVHLFLNGFNSF